MKKQFVKGRTVDEKLKSIDSQFNWFSKRLGKYVVGILPPIPIFEFVDSVPDDGVILRRMFPSDGAIPKGVMYVDEFTDKKQSLTVTVRVDGMLGGSDAKFETKQKMLIVEPNLPIKAGDRLTVSVEPPELAHGIWLSFLYEVPFKSTVKERYLLDELLELMESQNGEEAGEAA